MKKTNDNHEKSDVGKKGKSDIKKSKKSRIINIYLFGFQASAFTVIRKLEEYFIQRGYKSQEIVFFNNPENQSLPHKNAVVIFQTNEMRFSKKFGPDIRKFTEFNDVVVQVQYIPEPLFFRLEIP